MAGRASVLRSEDRPVAKNFSHSLETRCFGSAFFCEHTALAVHW